MRRTTLQILLSNVIAFSLASTGSQSAPGADGSIQPAKTLKGTVSENQMIDNLERVGIKCILQQQASGKRDLIIQKVRMGSSAYYKGVAEGDKVTGLATANDVFTLSIERKGQPFQVQLRALRPELASTTPLKTGAQQTDKLQTGPLMDVSEGKIPKLSVEEKKKADEKKLVQYDIEFIIDVTGSMGEADGTEGKSKFEWCHDQVKSFAQTLGQYKKTFTITVFNTAFKTEQNCNANRLENIYAEVRPSGDTNMVDPLSARLNDAYAHKQPGHKILIALITDGLPTVPKDPLAVNRAVIDFTQKMQNKDDVVVTFLQIGDNFEGKKFCIDLDDNLVAEGAKYDIVDTRTFDELKEQGLIAALIAAITENRPKVAHIRPAQSSSHMSAADMARVRAADGELTKKKQEREELENLLKVKQIQNGSVK